MAGFHTAVGLEAIPDAIRGGLVAIGSFDGMHRGHQHVFAMLKQRAAERGVPAVVLTFEPHPRDVLAPAPFMFRLTEADAKARLAEALGLDGMVVVPFTRDFSHNEAEDFVAKYLVGALAIKGVIVGDDFHFGRGRRGTPDFLRQAGREQGFDVEALELIGDGTAPVSSSRIREALGQGRLEDAGALLGYHWFIEGSVVTGDRRGRTLGYPTANLMPGPGFGLAQGVYAVRGNVGGRIFDGVASYGKPMFDNSAPPFETFFFDFDEDIYGQHVSIALLAMIRGQLVFPGLNELIAQIDNDAAAARRILATIDPLSPLDRKLGFFG